MTDSSVVDRSLIVGPMGERLIEGGMPSFLPFPIFRTPVIRTAATPQNLPNCQERKSAFAIVAVY